MKILVRLPNWLGDVVMSTAFIEALGETYPGSEIHVIIKKELHSLVPFLPRVTHSYPFSKEEFPGLTGAIQFGRRLAHKKFDLFFSLPDSFSSAVMGIATGSEKRVGYSREGRFFLLTHPVKKPENMHRADQYLHLLQQFTGERITGAAVKLSVTQPVVRNNTVLVNFNSEASSRRMPAAKAVAMLNKLTGHFRETPFVLIGSGKDQEEVRKIHSALKDQSGVKDLSGTTALAGLISLIAGSTLLLSTDSGPAHIANSLGIPVIVLFGAGNEANTAPYNPSARHILRAGKLTCEPCVKNTCLLYDLPECMNLLDDEQIIETLKLYLQDAGR